MMGQTLFTVLSLVAIASALGVVLMRNVVHSALLLGVCFSAIGGLYALLGADFLFAAQLLIYVGAIAILFLFVVLLAGRRSEIMAKSFNSNVFAGVIASIVLLALLTGIYYKIRMFFKSSNATSLSFTPTTGSIGDAILGSYAVGMEVLGLVLLIALVGVSLLAPQKESRKEAVK